MAIALVSFLVNELGTMIKDEIQQEVSLVVGVQGEIRKLTQTFRAIQIVLKDAEYTQFRNELVMLWLEEFKDVAYDMEDVLDEWRTEMLIKRQIKEIENAPNNKGKKKVHSFLHSLCSCFGEVGLRHDIGHRIKNIRERLDSIAVEKNWYHLSETNHNYNGPEHLVTSSLIDELVVYGRSIEKDIIISKLLGESGASSSTSSSIQQETGLSHPIIISIVGMGGLGKTTLAQLVFNSEQVKNHFEKNTMWVQVSAPFNLPRLAGAIIQEAGGRVPNNPEWNELHNSLSESVKEKRFLLVLDDVWNDDPIKWEPLALALKSGAEGSRILVTTRNKRVAEIMNSTYIHDLQILSDNDCWSIISHLAFQKIVRDKKEQGTLTGRDKQEQETLTDTGVEIAKKCKGLPLAAKALGSLLRFRSTEMDWEHVLNSDLWDIKEVENSFLKPALLLSYFDLPSSLKPCFTYCSIFPKDHMIQKDELIKLWMAQGFLNSTHGRREDLEMIGEEYFNNLVLRSFFQDFYFQNGNVYWCKMHDLLREFAQFLMRKECNIRQMDATHRFNDHHKIRHLTLISEYQESSFHTSIYETGKLRTFMLMGAREVLQLPPSFFSSFLCLKVLSLRSIGLRRLSSEIGKLIHLRCLDLSNNYNLMELPESITTLYNLQTLELMQCGGLSKLPEEMWRLKNLRYLCILACDLYLPQGIGKLTSLRTLTSFPLSGVTQSCKIKELKDLNNLEGELRISGLGGVQSSNEASEAGLRNKKHLRFLELEFTGFEEDVDSLILVDRMNGVLEGLEPPPKLERLCLGDYLGSKFPSWIADNSVLSHLKVLRLHRCINCIEFPALGRLSSLEELSVRTMNEIKQIGLESYRPSAAGTSGGGGVVMNGEKLFPKLKHLDLWNMDNLEELGNAVAEEEGIEIMPCLVYLRILECPKLKLPRKLINLEELNYSPPLSQLPFLPKLKYLKINGDSSVNRLPQGLLAELKALEKLEIVDFPELICIPEEVRHLTNLQELIIFQCEKLVPRCRKGEGEDWSIISHIPNISIEGRKIQ